MEMNCPFCDAPIEEDLAVCPHCGEFLLVEPEERPVEFAVTINLKRGNPDSELALARLDDVLNEHRGRRTRAMKLIHGYGSKGRGGIIRNVVRERLESLRYDREIRDFIPGEDIGAVPRSRFRQVYEPEPGDHGNAGITVVIL